MKIQNVKGGYDYLPQEQRIRNDINDTLKEIFISFGYQPIETPILCYYELLTDKYDEKNDIVKEIYKLNDQGNRALGLRYDLTVPFAKFIALNKNNLTFPFKRFEIAKVFRDGPIKLGRDREFTQCDVDVVGLRGGLIEAELMTLYEKAFKKLGIDIIIKYNSRKLMSGLILECGIKEENVSRVTTLIDKIEKLSKPEFIESLLNEKIERESINKLIEIFKCSLEELNEKFKKSENLKIRQGLKELNELTKYLEKLGLNKCCVFTPSLARGQNYYTGNVFEVYETSGFISGSIGAGGRYDQMITNFINDGETYPTVGISFGLSSIYEIVKQQKLSKNNRNLDIYIIPLETEIESLKLANTLRELGYKVELEMSNKKIKKSLDFANKNELPFVIILGLDEIKKGTFNLKDMKNNQEYEIDYSNVSEIKNIIKRL